MRLRPRAEERRLRRACACQPIRIRAPANGSGCPAGSAGIGSAAGGGNTLAATQLAGDHRAGRFDVATPQSRRSRRPSRRCGASRPPPGSGSGASAALETTRRERSRVATPKPVPAVESLLATESIPSPSADGDPSVAQPAVHTAVNRAGDCSAPPPARLQIMQPKSGG